MRRAFHIDAEAAGYAPLDEPARARVRALVSRYEAAEYGGSSADAGFMLAALHHLLGENLQARRAIERAIQAGDRSQSALRLQSILAADNAVESGLASPSGHPLVN